METLFCGIDLGTRASAICVIDGKKHVVKRWSGKNTEMQDFLKGLGSAIQCVVEAAPLAESICQLVESIKGRIEIIDPRHAKAVLHGKKKTDKIDAQVLAELAQMGWYKTVYRKEGKCREERTFLGSRAQIVKSATNLKNAIRGMFKANGIVLACGGEGVVFVKTVKKAMESLPSLVRSAIAQLLICWIQLTRSATRMYKMLQKIASRDATASLFMTVPGVGAATAIGFSSTIATHTRFSDKKKVSSYLGLAPKVYQSGDTSYHGHITKKGDLLVRWLLTEAAHSLLTRVKSSCALKEWGLRIAEKKGMAKAKVAVARKLAELLFTMWKTKKAFIAA